MAPLVLLLSMLAQQFPAEGQPIQPTRQVLWMTGPEIAQDLPAAPPGEPIDQMIVGPANVFTSQAEMNTFCAAAISAANAIYAADPANPTRLRLAGCIYLSGYVTPNDMQQELPALYFSFHPPPLPVGATTIPGLTIALRDQYRADRVTMISNSPTCGLAYMSASIYGKLWAFSVVNKNCAISNESFVHELGHNDGLCHDTPNASGCTPAFPYGYGFCDNVAPTPHGRQSPMTYPSPCGGTRVIFSNKDNSFTYGYPFGDASHDEAAVQRWGMPIEADFYPSTCTSALTLLPATLANGSTGHAYTQTFTASGGTGPYTFSVTTGTVPAGLTFTTATLSGTPTTAGVSTFTVGVSDTTGCTTNLAYSLTVLGLPTAPTNLRVFP